MIMFRVAGLECRVSGEMVEVLRDDGYFLGVVKVTETGRVTSTARGIGAITEAAIVAKMTDVWSLRARESAMAVS